MRLFITTLSAVASMSLAGCDQLGLESATAVATKRDAEGRAVGAGCRHAARSVEQCYAQNKKADKAAVFAGWREMNDYMRENKIDPMPAPIEPAAAALAAADDAPAADPAKPPPGKH